MAQTLEERLSTVTPEDFESLRYALQCSHVNPSAEHKSMPYFKFDLTNRIARYLAQNSEIPEDFEGALDTVNKDPLKRVYYGIRSLGKMPSNVLNALTDWQKVYFLAGRWKIKQPNLQEPGQVIVAKHLLEGLKNLYEQHFVRKAKGQYTRQLEMPEDGETREQARQIILAYENPVLTESETQEYNHITNLIKAEQGLIRNDLIEAQERTACALDRTSSKVLRALSRQYDEKQLGAYYTKSR